MRKLLIIFTVLFLLAIVLPVLDSANAGKSEIGPKGFSEWIIDSVMVSYFNGEVYVWVKNPSKKDKINRAILKVHGRSIIEYIYWSKNDTNFIIVRRFKYNVRKNSYDEIIDGGKKWLIE